MVTGSLKYMESGYNVIGYGRFTREEQSVILVNNNNHEITKKLSVWYLGTPKTGVMKRLMLTTADGFTTEEAEYPVSGGKVKITLPPTSAIVLKRKRIFCGLYKIEGTQAMIGPAQYIGDTGPANLF